MTGHRPLQSPVLVGRDDLLALADRRLAEAAAGRGHLLFVAGEAGIGKTRLLATVAEAASRRSFGVVRAAAFPGDVEASGGLLLDLASDLRQSGAARLREVGEAMAGRLRELAGVGGDRHRQRRLLVQDLADESGRIGGGDAVLVVLEDLHWADQLSLEVVAHLAARLAGRPLLVAGAYRSDELYPRLPMRQWRARLLTARQAEEVRLPRLTRDQTAALTRALLGQAPAARIVEAVHDRSDGIPLHVEELLAAVEDPATEPGPGAIPAVPVPDTLADAVLTRARALDDRARQVAEAGAVIGRSFELDLLGAVSRLDPEAVDHGLRQLQERYLVVPGADPQGSFDFRHALIRDVLYDDIPLPRRRRLHERVATVAAGRGYRDAFVSAHFEQAGLAGPAHRHALTAAREAAALSAHREALALYRRAQRNLPAGQARPSRRPCWPPSATRPPPSTTTPPPSRPTSRPTGCSPGPGTGWERPRWWPGWSRSPTCSARTWPPGPAAWSGPWPRSRRTPPPPRCGRPCSGPWPPPTCSTAASRRPSATASGAWPSPATTPPR